MADEKNSLGTVGAGATATGLAAGAGATGTVSDDSLGPLAALPAALNKGMEAIIGDDKEETTPEEDAEKTGERKNFRFQQQCFLASYWDVFAAANKHKTYENFVEVGGNKV